MLGLGGYNARPDARTTYHICAICHIVFLPARSRRSLRRIRRIERTVASLGDEEFRRRFDWCEAAYGARPARARATLDDLADNDQKRDTEREPPQRANDQLTARWPCSPPSPVPARLEYRHVSRIISLPQFRNAAVGAFYRFFAPEEQARTPQPSGRPSEMGDRRR